jgi:hypothetical protein
MVVLFHAYINEMHGSRSKIKITKISNSTIFMEVLESKVSSIRIMCDSFKPVPAFLLLLLKKSVLFSKSAVF